MRRAGRFLYVRCALSDPIAHLPDRDADTTLRVRVPHELADAVDRFGARWGMCRSAAVRVLLIRALLDGESRTTPADSTLPWTAGVSR